MGPAAARRVLRRVGHRGAFLLFLAVLDVAFGYSLLGEPSTALQVENLIFPTGTWGWIWGAAGLVCLVFAFMPPQRDTPGFGVAAALKFGWVAAEVRAGILMPEPRWWVAPVIFTTLALTVLVIASWPEPAGGSGRRGDQRV